jgi:hypothetical protein
MAIRVYPGAKRPSHHLSLSDGVQTFGLQLADGSRSIQEIPMTPSTVQFTGGGTKFGDWEPGMSHIEQRTWVGGRGQSDFVDDPTRFYDSKMAWTLTPGKLFPVPRWKYANGHRVAVENLPGDLDWRALYGDYTAIAEAVNHPSGWSAYYHASLWLRKVGNPGTLTVKLQTNNMGEPGILKASDSLAASEVNEAEVYLWEFDLSGGSALIGTESFLVALGNALDDAANHWQIGVDKDGGSGIYYDDKTGWDSADFSLYYRFTDARIDRKWHFFEMKGALYAVDHKADGTASQLYINGDRGKVTSASNSWVIDANQNWDDDLFNEAYVKITAGTGKGHSGRISDTQSDRVGFSPSSPVELDTTSEYVIYHTPVWQEISPGSGDLIDGVVSSVAVVGEVAAFAQGQSINILKMRWNPNAAPPAHEFDDDGTNKADLLYSLVDATNELQVYAANADAATISRAAPSAWLTDMVFGTAFKVADSSQPLTSLYQHQGRLYAFKPDGRYRITTEDSVVKDLSEIGFIRSANNGQAVLSHGLFSYFSWGGYSLQRLYDLSGTYALTNLGPDRDEGLLDERKGPIVALVGIPHGIVAAVDGDEKNFSSVLVLPTDSYGWHEVFRGAAAGKRVQNLYFQDSYRPRLWLDYDGELVYQDWPRHTFNPLKDAGITYQEEAHLISSTIDMGVSRLPKLIKEISAVVENLASGIETALDYQVNEEVGSDRWTQAGSFQLNPQDCVPVNRGEVYRIRFRLRLLSNDESSPPIVHATVLEGFARTPVKYQWNLRIKVSSTQRELTGLAMDAEPDEFLKWLQDSAVNSRRIFMRSIWRQMDSKYVLVEPPTLLRQFSNNILGYWGGSVVVTLREI